jgi:hypothetical protein
MTDGEVLIRASEILSRASHDHVETVMVRAALRVAAEWCRRAAVVTR